MRVKTLKICECVFFLAILTEFADFAFSRGQICPPLKLINGRCRYRLRGRNVRFNCVRGFQLVGAKYATCTNGKWDAAVPICVKYGCRAPSRTHVNGQFIESYRGAVVKIICNPGYGLVGSPSVYCNGFRWNETFPVCKVFNDNPASSCDFESEDLCGWSQDPMHDFDWRRNMALEQTGEILGPRSDSTYGLNGSGHYMYIASSKSRAENATARLYSPVYPSQLSNGTCFKFSYYMNGENSAGTLKVFVKPEDVELYNLIPSFWMVGKQGNSWIRTFFHLEQTKTPFQVVVEGITSTGYESYTAFDDAQITSGDECILLENSLTSTDFPTSVSTIQFEDDEISNFGCRNRCNQTKTSSLSAEEEFCDCQEQCILSGNCCSDYFDVCRISVSTSVTTESERNILTSTFSPAESETGSSPSNTGNESRIPFEVPPNNIDFESNEIIPLKPISVSPPSGIFQVNETENEISVSESESGNQQRSENEIGATEKSVASAILPVSNETVSGEISVISSGENETVSVSDETPASNKTISDSTFAIGPETGKTVSVAVSGNELPVDETVSVATYGKLPAKNDTDSIADSEKISAIEGKVFPMWKIPNFHPANPNISEAVKQTGKKTDVETDAGFKAEPKKSSDFSRRMSKPEVETRKSFGRKNHTVETVNRNAKTGNGSVESNEIFPLPLPPSDSPSTSGKIFKTLRMPNAINPNLVEKVSVSESRHHKGKPKEFLGKEPPQAIKIDRSKEESGAETFGGVLESAGICSALLVIAIVSVGFICYRRRKNRKSDRTGMVEDSDVRFLTSDQVLDFTLARPADDDL